MTARRTVIRAALAGALLVMAGTFALVGIVWPVSGGAPVLIVLALLPLAASGLVYVSRTSTGTLPTVSASLAIAAALLAVLFALAPQICFMTCSQGSPPLRAESIAMLLVALVVLALAVADLAAVGLVKVGVAIGLAVLFVANGRGFFVAIVVVAAVVIWRMFRRRGSGSGPPPTER